MLVASSTPSPSGENISGLILISSVEGVVFIVMELAKPGVPKPADSAAECQLSGSSEAAEAEILSSDTPFTIFSNGKCIFSVYDILSISFPVSDISTAVPSVLE